MRIIFVRHGHPNYQKDCLTELGHRHAEAAAQRLNDEKIKNVYSSSCGRAVETAEHIAAPRKLKVQKCNFMREILWGSIDGQTIFAKGHPWDIVDDMVSKGQSVLHYDWEDREQFSNNKIVGIIKNVTNGFDEWLATLGYEREGLYYRVRNKNTDTVAMVSHGGSSTAVFSHLFNMPFPLACALIRVDFTSITVVSFEGKEGSIISPTIEILNDARHIANIKSEMFFGN